MRHLCLRCADAGDVPAVRSERRLHYAAILLVVGLLVLVVSSAADVLQFGDAAGFGKWQILGVLLAGFLLLIGTMTRIFTLLAIGLITGVLTVLADWLGFGNAEGFGFQQIGGCLVGIALIAAGLLVARRQR